MKSCSPDLVVEPPTPLHVWKARLHPTTLPQAVTVNIPGAGRPASQLRSDRNVVAHPVHLKCNCDSLRTKRWGDVKHRRTADLSGADLPGANPFGIQRGLRAESPGAL